VRRVHLRQFGRDMFAEGSLDSVVIFLFGHIAAVGLVNAGGEMSPTPLADPLGVRGALLIELLGVEMNAEMVAVGPLVGV
jgi:hypothetical protein